MKKILFATRKNQPQTHRKSEREREKEKRFLQYAKNTKEKERERDRNREIGGPIYSIRVSEKSKYIYVFSEKKRSCLFN